jgi:subtilisin family serine protease
MRFSLLLSSFFLLPLFFYGCGTSSTKDTIDQSSQTQFHGISSEQWYMQKDTNFYVTNGINSDAHIHPDTNTYQTFAGYGVKIAIIDDGFDINHPEIKDKIIATSYVKDNGTITTDVTHSYAIDHHGTAVAGIIGSKDDGVGIRGIAPDAGLILLKMPDLLSDSNVIKLFDEAVRYGADVINCSWGTGDVSKTVRDHINALASSGRNGKGIIVVFASGNGDSKIKECNSIDIGNDEAGIENVIGVGATDGDNLRTCYSNYGDTLDIVAPGGYYDSISTLDPLGTNGVSNNEYNRYNQIENGTAISFIGTSASAPIITGAISLLLEKNPNLTALEVQEKLKTATDTIGQNTPYIYDMVSSNSHTPTISGIYGINKLSTFKVQLISNSTNTTYGSYAVTSGLNNTWHSQVGNSLPNGTYKIELVDNDGVTIWATDNNFIIDESLSYSTIITQKLKSNYYGYGKINLSKLLQ